MPNSPRGAFAAREPISRHIFSTTATFDVHQPRIPASQHCGIIGLVNAGLGRPAITRGDRSAWQGAREAARSFKMKHPPPCLVNSPHERLFMVQKDPPTSGSFCILGRSVTLVFAIRACSERGRPSCRTSTHLICRRRSRPSQPSRRPTPVTRLRCPRSFLKRIGFAPPSRPRPPRPSSPRRQPVTSAGPEPSTVPAGSRIILIVSRGPSPAPPAVPVGMLDIVGEQQGAALLKLQGLGLSAQVLHDHNDRLPRGYVIGQHPMPGAGVLAGGEVVVLVSSGKAQIPTPDVMLPRVVGLHQTLACGDARGGRSRAAESSTTTTRSRRRGSCSRRFRATSRSRFRCASAAASCGSWPSRCSS